MKLHQFPAIFLCSVALATMTGCGSSDPGTTDSDTPEIVTVAEQGDLSALNKLLKRQHPDVRDSCEWTPLMKAALNGHLDVVQRLLEAGAGIDAEDKGGYTPLMLAASNNHVEIVNLLLEHGARVDHREQTHGWTALIWAANKGNLATVDTLLRHHADPSIKDFDGKTAIDWAREQNRPQVLTRLQQTAANTSS